MTGDKVHSGPGAAERLTGALLVAGTTSDAGKSTVVAGLARWLHRRGVRVAPFKAQNMSLNSGVTADGAEIGRAQLLQAAAAGIEPEAVMNPVLLKPGGERHSQVVVLGRAAGTADAVSYADWTDRLRLVVAEALADLRGRYDVVLCEGAGSPAEINLRERDLANLGLARSADLPMLVVGDIDRGGVFAALYGTLALLDPADQRHVAGFVVNKFRGDPSVLEPGLAALTRSTGRPVLGVLPWLAERWIDAEDSLALDSPAYGPDPAFGGDTDARPLRVAVVRLPRISNVTDVDPLRVEPGIRVVVTASPAEVADADLAVVPGTRATVEDLDWLRRQGLADVLRARAEGGRAVLGICGGYQMLTDEIVDDVESGAGRVAGLGLLPGSVRFASDKTVRRAAGTAYGEPVDGYEIHHGLVTPGSGESFLDGQRVGTVWGTSWHGIFEADGFRRAFLADVAARVGVEFRPATTAFADLRERQVDVLADLLDAHLDTDRMLDLIANGVPTGLPVLESRLA